MLNCLGIFHTFHFTSRLKRMGVITKNLVTYDYTYYTKGAPEVILERCDPESIPKNVSKILRNYTCSGYRLLACAYRSIEPGLLNELKSSSIEDFENNLQFLGLVILQNKLKPQTLNTIQVLHEAGIKTVMATGDAVLTGISVARECCLINPSITVYLGELREDKVYWEIFGADDNVNRDVSVDFP